MNGCIATVVGGGGAAVVLGGSVGSEIVVGGSVGGGAVVGGSVITAIVTGTGSVVGEAVLGVVAGGNVAGDSTVDGFWAAGANGSGVVPTATEADGAVTSEIGDSDATPGARTAVASLPSLPGTIAVETAESAMSPPVIQPQIGTRRYLDFHQRVDGSTVTTGTFCVPPTWGGSQPLIAPPIRSAGLAASRVY